MQIRETRSNPFPRRSRSYLTFAMLLILALSLAVHAAEATHPFSVRDMLAMDRIGDPQVSPDGQWVVFVVRQTDLEANRGRSDLWLISTDGMDLRQLTTHPDSDANPRWAPDSRSIWFVSGRSGSSQVWRIAIDGGEAQQVTDEPLDVGNLIVAPDGRHLAFTMSVFPDAETLQGTVDKLEAIKERQASGRLYESIFVRHWDTWKDGRRSHLFVKPAAGGPAIDVMKGMDADTPSQPFGGPDEMTFTPDGKAVVFSARDVGREEAWSTDFDLYLSPVDDSAPKCLTAENEAWDTTPVFSPDGQTLAYLAMERPGYESDRFRIVLMDWLDGKTQILTENWDRSPSSLCWAPDGRTIYASATNLGQRSLFAVDATDGRVRTLITLGSIQGIATAKDRVVYALSNLAGPAELYSIASDGSGRKQLTNINAAQVASARTGEYEQFTFRGWNDETVHAYVVKPIDFDPDKKYPVAFLIHGGPQGSFGNVFHYRWNPQAYAGAGYAAVMVDFHGSTGYGQTFCDSIRGDWGGKPLEDLQKGLAAALERYPWMDGDRVGALGASFGGFMINWIAGNWPDRFRCLVNHDGNLDERMAYYDTEELWFPEWDHMGTPWDNPTGYEKHNPVNFVQNWKTPMLVIHGAQDSAWSIPRGSGRLTSCSGGAFPANCCTSPTRTIGCSSRPTRSSGTRS